MMRLPLFNRDPEVPRSAEFDPTPGGVLLADLKEGVLKVDGIDTAFTALSDRLRLGSPTEELLGEVEAAQAVATEKIYATYPQSGEIEKWLGTEVALRRPPRYTPRSRFLGVPQLRKNNLWLIHSSEYVMKHDPQSGSSGKLSEGVTLHGRIANISPASRGTIVLEDGYKEVVSRRDFVKKQIVDIDSPMSKFAVAWIDHVFDTHHHAGIEVVKVSTPQETEAQRLALAFATATS